MKIAIDNNSEKLSANQLKLINSYLRLDAILVGLFLIFTQVIIFNFFNDQFKFDITIYLVIGFSFYLGLQKNLLKSFSLIRNTLLIFMIYIVYVSLTRPFIAYEHLFMLSIALGILIFEKNEKRANILFYVVIGIGILLVFREITQENKDEIVFDNPINLSILGFFLIDISRRIRFLFSYQKLITEEQRKSATKYESIFKNSLLGVVTSDIERNLIDANEAFCSMLGYEKEELLKKKIEDIYTSQSLEDVKSLVDQLRKGEIDSYEHQSFFLNKHGDVIPTDIHVKGVYKEGVFSNSIVIVKDISKRLDVEEKLKKSETRLRSIFDDTACGLALLRNHSFVTCNEAFLDILEVEISSLNNQSIFEIITKNNPIARDEIRQRFESRALDNYSFETKIEVDSNDKYIQVFIKVRHDSANSDNRYSLLSVFDISELVKSRKDLEGRNHIISAQFSELHLQKMEMEKYLESNSQLENFASIAAHDLKSPLRTIGSFAQLLKISTRDLLDESQMSYLDRIIKSSSDLHVLTEDILQFSKIDNQKVNVEKINVQEFISHNLLLLESEIEQSMAQIRLVDLPDSIYADKVKISQVFQNLVRNAIKFRKVDLAPIVEISSIQNDEYWTICIKDNGIGIKKEFQEKVFDIFNKLHKSSKFEGTGLGLAIVKKIIEQHKGQVWLDSEFGVGTTFYFTLPKLSFPSNEINKSESQSLIPNKG